MTLALKEELAGRGYEVTVVSNVGRNADERDEFDYGSIETDADAIVSARGSLATEQAKVRLPCS